jgi:capsular polysaccharide biosynthesis protein
MISKAIEKFNIFSSESIIRNKPINLIDEDLALFKNEIKRNFKKVEYLKLKNAMILCNGVVFKDKLYLKEYFNTSRIKLRHYIKYYILFFLNYIFSYKKIKLDKAILITDHYSGSFFHWFGDVLQKLELIKNKKNLNSYTIIFPYETISEYAEYTLVKYNLNYIILNKYRKATINELIILPHLSSPTGNFRPELVTRIRNRFRIRDDINKNLRIFISREKAERRKLLNEYELIPVLKKYNFKIVYMEELNFRSQIELISKANILIGLHGAGLTNMLWLPKKSKVLEIRARNDNSNNCYFSLASALGLDYYYLLSKNKEYKNIYDAELFVDLKDFKRTIEIIINDQ